MTKVMFTGEKLHPLDRKASLLTVRKGVIGNKREAYKQFDEGWTNGIPTLQEFMRHEDEQRPWCL